MAGPTTWNVHWRVPFVSLAGRAYNADIYEYGYNGNIVTLKGAPQPFVTQENNDDDIFTPVRTQTGYLRVVLTADQSSLLEQIIPANNTEKMVKLTHTENNATVVDWQGFMQTRVFSQPWEGTAHMVEFPLNSMLASLEHKRVPTSLANSGTVRSLGVITTALESLGTDLMGGLDNIDDNEGAWMTALIDWNAFFSADTEQEEGYKMQTQFGISYLEAVERVCETFGVIAREHGNRLILSQYDGGTELSQRSVTWAVAKNIGAGTANPSSGTALDTPLDVLDPTTGISWRGNDNQANYMPGAHKVEIKFSPGQVGNAAVIAVPEQDFDDDTDAEELKLADSDGSYCWVQNFLRTNTVESFYNKGLQDDDGQPTSYTDVTAEYIRKCFSVMQTGLRPVPPFYLWGSGAWPVVFGAKYDKFANVEMQPGLFLQQIEFESNIQEDYCYDIMTAGSVTLKAGSFININFKHHPFWFEYNQIEGKADPIYFAGNGQTSGLISVFGIGVIVGNRAFAGSRTIPQTMQDLIDNDLTYYGQGSWGTALHNPTVNVGIRDSEVINNEVTNINMINYNGGFLIPVTEDLSGRMRIRIGNLFAVNAEHAGQYTSKILTDLEVSILQTAPPYYSGSNTNVYKRNLDNVFKAEKTTELKLGTVNCNQPSSALLLNSSGYLKTITYTDGTTERPEKHLLSRMAAYYNVTRRAFEGQIFDKTIENGQLQPGPDIWKKRWEIDDKLYMGVDETHEWDMDRQKVKFIEVTS